MRAQWRFYFCISNNQVSFAFVQESLFPHLNQSSARSESGQSRRFSDVGMSASPPTPDVSLQGNEPTLRANSGREQVQQQGCAVEGAPQLLSDLVGAAEQRRPAAERNLALIVFPGGTAPSRPGPPRTSSC